MPIQQTINLNLVETDGLTPVVTYARFELEDGDGNTTAIDSNSNEVTLTANNIVIDSLFGDNPPVEGTGYVIVDYAGQTCNEKAFLVNLEYIPGIIPFNLEFTEINAANFTFEKDNAANFTNNSFNLPVGEINPSDIDLLGEVKFNYSTNAVADDPSPYPSNSYTFGSSFVNGNSNPGLAGYSFLPYQGFGCEQRGDFTGSLKHAGITDFGVPRVIQYATLYQSYNNFGPVSSITEILIEASNDASTWTTLFDNSGDTYTNLASAESTFGFRLYAGFNDNRTAYRYYRLRTTVTGSNRYTYPCVSWGVGYYTSQNDDRFINDWYYTQTNINSQLDTSLSNLLNVFINNEIIPINTDAKYLISIDGRNNWGVFTDASTFVSKVTQANLTDYDWSPFGNAMTKTQIEQYQFDISGTNTIDFAIGIRSTNSSVTPTIEGISGSIAP